MASEIINNIRHWWIFLLRGLLFVLFGIYILNTPLVSFEAISFLLGAVIIIAGIAELIHSYANRYIAGQVYRFYIGLLDVALGLLIAFDLKIIFAVLPLILGVWFLIRGFSLFSFAGVIRNSWLLMIVGVVTIIFALLVIFNPAFGVMTIVLWAAYAFIITGISNVVLAFRLKAANELLPENQQRL